MSNNQILNMDGLIHRDNIPRQTRDFIDKYFGFDSFLTLHNYHSSGLTARLSLPGTLLELYKQINSGGWETLWGGKFGPKEKIIVLEMIQIDMLSKTMIAIEDLSTFSSCFPNNIKGLYGKVYNESNFSFVANVIKNKPDFADIFGFPSASALKLVGNEMLAYNKCRHIFHSVIRAQFLALDDFRKTYYQAYIGSKHSYAGLMPYCRFADSNTTGANIQEETIWIGEKGKPFSFDYGGFIINNYDNVNNYFTAMCAANNLIEYLIDNWLEKVWYKDINMLPVNIYNNKEINADELSTIKYIWKTIKDRGSKLEFGVEIGKPCQTEPRIYGFVFSDVFKAKLSSPP